MTGFIDLFNIALTPLVISGTDMLLLFYLCGGTRETIRKKRFWGVWFVLILIGQATTIYFFSDSPSQNGNIYIFYLFRCAFMFLFSSCCTDTQPNARFYLVVLVVLTTDITLISFVRFSQMLFSIDYYLEGPILFRLLAHLLLLTAKTIITVFIKSQTRSQIYGIQTFFQAVIIVLPALPYFYMRDYSHLFNIKPADIPLSIHFVTILCGICALINMIVNENLSYHIRLNEKLRLESIIKKQREHYIVTQNSIETVNRKYHDLRHILRGINSLHSVAEIQGYINSVEKDIQGYELICNTGNTMLDVILSEKMRECKEKGIQMHIRADGQEWDAVSDADIATIFGNALDNAIESAEQIKDTSLRFIEVHTNRMNDMLIARFENQYTHLLEKKQAHYLTTKPDKANHGYGLQSIELTVKRYGGEIDINTEGGCFALSVIIPVYQAQTAD